MKLVLGLCVWGGGGQVRDIRVVENLSEVRMSIAKGVFIPISLNFSRKLFVLMSAPHPLSHALW